MVYNITTCPFCRGRGEVKGRKRKWVECKKCGARGPRLPFLLDAIAAWNNREEMIVVGTKSKA
jgi:transposase